MDEKTKCFAYWDSPKGWRCVALNVGVCEWPSCKTFKTRDMIIEEKQRCMARIESLPPDKKYEILLKYGEYKIF